MLNTVMHDDFVWTAITGSLTGSRRTSNTNFININCPMCVRTGRTPDFNRKCGVKKDAEGIGIYCFRCDFRTRFQVGQLLSTKMKDFLQGVGVPSMEIKRINHKALGYRRLVMASPIAAQMIPTLSKPSFPPADLPDGAKSFTQLASEGCADPDFLAVAEYLFSRGDVVANATEFYWSPTTKDQMNRRMILPFTYNGRIVGYTARLIDKETREKPKYTSRVPSHFLFNSHLIDGDGMYLFVQEGVLDALAVDGVSTLGSKMTTEQVHWLNSTGKTIIVIPDRDKAGERMIDVALKNNWMVAFPTLKEGSGTNNWWDHTVKDCAKATSLYGKLYVIRSIIETATSNKLQINICRQLMYDDEDEKKPAGA